MRYIFSAILEAFVMLATRRMSNGLGAVLFLEGPPGGGKTSFAKALGERLGGAPVYYYSGSPDKERDLLYEIDVEGVLKRERAWVPGPAWQAFAASQEGPAVLLIDEVDKTGGGFDAFLLRLLEDWAFRAPGGETVVANPANLAVVMTSNGRRKLRPEVLRRAQRVFVPIPDNGRLATIIRGIAAPTLLPDGLLELVVRLGDEVRKEAVEMGPSPKEMALLCMDCLTLAEGQVTDLSVWRGVAASHLTKDSDRAGHLDKVTRFNWGKALRTEASQREPRGLGKGDGGLRVSIRELTK